MKHKKEGVVHRSLVVGPATIPYTITTSSGRKTLAIRVRPPGTVDVRAPAGTPTDEVVRFVEEKRSWISGKVRMMQERIVLGPEKKYVTGETLLYLGQEYRLVVEEGRSSAVLLRERDLVVVLPQARLPSPGEEVIRDQLYSWYLARARVVFQERIRHWAGQLGVSPPPFSIRNQKSKWGSCSPNNTVSINVRLLMAPLGTIDYIVLHELCHIVHKNHSPAFWGLVRAHMPDYPQRKEELKKNEWRYVF
jgi:predicted metal-dependent hydrolase